MFYLKKLKKTKLRYIFIVSLVYIRNWYFYIYKGTCSITKICIFFSLSNFSHSLSILGRLLEYTSCHYCHHNDSDSLKDFFEIEIEPLFFNIKKKTNTNYTRILFLPWYVHDLVRNTHDIFFYHIFIMKHQIIKIH